MSKIKWSIALLFMGGLLNAYSSSATSSGFSFPIDGGRKVSPVVNTQTGKELAIGYITVTSVDANSALNASQDQESANQLLNQINQLYIQIYNQYAAGAKTNSKPAYCPPQRYTPKNSTMSSCEHRKSSKWRSS